MVAAVERPLVLAPDLLHLVLEQVLCPDPKCTATVSFREISLGKNPAGEELWKVIAYCSACKWTGQLTQTRAHEMTLERWRDFLWKSFPEDYADPDPPAYPTSCLPGTEEKIRIFEARHERGLYLRHHLDSRGEFRLARFADPGRNGRCHRDTDWQAETKADIDPDDEIEVLPGPQAMVNYLASRGIEIGRLELAPCPECGWKHRRRTFNRATGDAMGPSFCSWCGLELADEITMGNGS